MHGIQSKCGAMSKQIVEVEEGQCERMGCVAWGLLRRLSFASNTTHQPTIILSDSDESLYIRRSRRTYPYLYPKWKEIRLVALSGTKRHDH